MTNFEEIEQAKAILKKHGYQVHNLWHIDDAKSKFNLSDDDAYDLVYRALTNDATMEQIWLAIDIIGDIEGYEEADGF